MMPCHDGCGMGTGSPSNQFDENLERCLCLRRHGAVIPTPRAAAQAWNLRENRMVMEGAMMPGDEPELGKRVAAAFGEKPSLGSGRPETVLGAQIYFLYESAIQNISWAPDHIARSRERRREAGERGVDGPDQPELLPAPGWLGRFAGWLVGRLLAWLGRLGV